MKSKFNKSTAPKVIDLFCGCGGMSLGFSNAGYLIKAAFDNWDDAINTYNSNFAHRAKKFDLSEVDLFLKEIDGIEADMIIGGPPCQDFSIAGKRVEKERANLTVSFSKIVSRKRPKFAVMENVYSIIGSKSLAKCEKILREANYGITKLIVDASLTGVPQKRKRFIMIAALGLKDDSFLEAIQSGLSTKPTTVKDYFGELLDIQYYYAHPRSYLRRAIFSTNEPSSTIRRVNRPIPKNYQMHKSDACAPSASLRALTTKERAAIQTFPNDFVFTGSTSVQEHLIANAVPVKLAEFIANRIKSQVKEIIKG
jgi:DNA (cytosine-5)-methyltransferase 1